MVELNNNKAHERRLKESKTLSNQTNNSDHSNDRRKPRRPLRYQILSIAAIGTLGFFAFLYVMLTESKGRADLLKEIQDVSYPVQEKLLASLHDLKFIDSNLEQATFSDNRTLIDHSMLLAGKFRSSLYSTMMLDNSKVTEVNRILDQFDIYFGNSHALALAVISKQKSLQSITPEKQKTAQEFNTVIGALGDLQNKHNDALVASVEAATLRASNAVRTGLTTGLITAALLFIVGLIITSSIVQRINNMVSSLRQIANGKGDMSERIPLTGSDEMTELAYWFNTFIEKLQRLTVESTNEIKRLAYTDPLTNLPNRRMFLQCLNTEIERIKGSEDKQLAVLFLDLDNFKPVNDQLGHDAGDELIRIVAKRLFETVRDTDTIATSNEQEVIEHLPGQAVVARLAGDEFMMIISDLDSPDQAEIVAQRIRESVMRPITIHGMECSVGVSIGICIFPDNAQDANELITCADIAMYEAKNSGKNTYRFFDPALKETSDLKIKMDNAIKTAIANEELHLLFQPKFRLSDKKLVGAEALLRWENEELGTFCPSEFIAQAEANGKMCELDDWVLANVIEHLSNWQRNGLEPQIAINFSAIQASRPNLGAAVERLAGKRHDLLNQLEIEITETSAIDNITIVENNILDLKARGIKIAMDDFGAGHSSLTLLTRCPIDTLKLDKEVTKNIGADEKGRTIVQSIINLAISLDISVVAEGIENDNQVQTLTAMNCDYGQGYYFSEPLSAAQFTAFLHSQNTDLSKAA